VIGGLVRGDSPSAAADLMAILQRGVDDRSAEVADDGESGA
jgi:hypothetical protein